MPNTTWLDSLLSRIAEGLEEDLPDPASGNLILYYATDTNTLFASNGASWQVVGDGGSGGPAGGDLSGTYPNPTVAKIQNRLVETASPSDGDVLTWNNGANEWQAIAPTSATPGGNNGEVQIRNGSAFAGATRVVAGTEFMAFGTNPASVGNIRFSNDETIYSKTNASADVAVVNVTNANGLKWGDTGYSAGNDYTTSSGSFHRFSFGSTNSITLGDAFASIGTNPATLGTIRLPAGAADVIVRVEDGGSNNKRILATSNTNDLYVGSNVGLTTAGQFTTVNIFPSNSVAIGTGSTTLFYGTSITGAHIWQGVLNFGSSGYSTTGSVRFRNTDSIKGRNAGNSADAVLLDWDASNNVTVGDGTNASNVISAAATKVFSRIAGTDYLEVGSGFVGIGGGTLATAGVARVKNTFTLQGRNAANSANASLVDWTSGNNIVVGEATNVANTILAAATTTFPGRVGDTDYLEVGSGYVGLGGGTLATAGTVRIKNAWTLQGRNAAGSANATLINWNSSNNLLVGEATSVSNMVLQASTGIALGRIAGTDYLSVGSGFVETGGGTVATAGVERVKNTYTLQGRNAANSANAVLINWDSSNNLTMGDSNVSSTRLVSSADVLLQPGGTTILKTTTGNVLVTKGIVGDEANNSPFAAHGAVTQAMPDANLTIPNTTYKFKKIRFTGALTATRTVTFPNPALLAESYEKTIENATTGGGTHDIVCSVGVGTTVTVGSGKSAIVSFENSNVVRVTADV